MMVVGCANSGGGSRVVREQGGMSGLAGGVEERKVAYSEELRYPDDWPEISARREAGR